MGFVGGGSKQCPAGTPEKPLIYFPEALSFGAAAVWWLLGSGFLKSATFCKFMFPCLFYFYRLSTGKAAACEVGVSEYPNDNVINLEPKGCGPEDVSSSETHNLGNEVSSFVDIAIDIAIHSTQVHLKTTHLLALVLFLHRINILTEHPLVITWCLHPSFPPISTHMTHLQEWSSIVCCHLHDAFAGGEVERQARYSS